MERENDNKLRNLRRSYGGTQCTERLGEVEVPKKWDGGKGKVRQNNRYVKKIKMGGTHIIVWTKQFVAAQIISSE